MATKGCQDKNQKENAMNVVLTAAIAIAAATSNMNSTHAMELNATGVVFECPSAVPNIVCFKVGSEVWAASSPPRPTGSLVAVRLLLDKKECDENDCYHVSQISITN